MSLHDVLDPLVSLCRSPKVLGLVVPLLAMAWPMGSHAAEPDLARGVANPSNEYKPPVYWCWLYNRVDKEGITGDLEAFHDRGISGVNLSCTGGYAGLEPIPGLDFLGPEWPDCFRHAVKEAKRLDIEVGFNLAGGWVMMGPWVTPKATYRRTFDLIGEPGSRVFLDLGSVRHLAEVRLNGKKLGGLWTAPWRVEITGVVRPSGNVLEIDVVNLWANRVIGDLGLPKEERLTKTHDAFRFDMITKDTPLLESGLLGPVRVLRAEGPR